MEYKDDGQPTFVKIPEEDIDIAAQEYGEGYEPLINCLKTCWQNGIQTFACCSGHEYEEATGNHNTSGYISFIVEDSDLFNYIINKMTDTKLLKSIGLQSCSEIEKCKKTEIRGKTEINFHCKFENREKFFNEFARTIKEYDREKKDKFTEEKGVTKIMKLFMNRTCDDRIMVDYICTEDQGFYNVNYCLDQLNTDYRYFTEEEMENGLSYLSEKTRPKSKIINALINMCENLENMEKVGLSRLMEIRKKLEEQLKPKQSIKVEQKNNEDQR